MASLDNFRLVAFRAVAEQLSFRETVEGPYRAQAWKEPCPEPEDHDLLGS